MLSKEEVHQLTGMKVSELIAIERADGGYKVTTHDGQSIFLEETGDGAEVAHQEPRDPDKVPDGSERDVLAWVGDDPERAAAAYVVEQDRDPVRKGLSDKLQKLAG